jgi:hypothetical protein
LLFRFARWFVSGGSYSYPSSLSCSELELDNLINAFAVALRPMPSRSIGFCADFAPSSA